MAMKCIGPVDHPEAGVWISGPISGLQRRDIRRNFLYISFGVVNSRSACTGDILTAPPVEINVKRIGYAFAELHEEKIRAGLFSLPMGFHHGAKQ